MAQSVAVMPRRYSYPALLLLLLVLFLPFPVSAEHSDEQQTDRAATNEKGRERWFDLEIETDAYYSNVALFLALTSKPIPQLGEKKEAEIYQALLSGSLIPRFMVLEASVNPLPYAGAYIRKNHTRFYDNAEVSGSFNWVKAVTAGFQEPYAVSLFFGNVVDFDIPEKPDVKGKGYSGLLMSVGDRHIKDNVLIRDNWREFEWKVKGDRKSPERKLSWSFRLGLKLHEHPEITDILFLSMRRSRLDYKPSRSSFLDNSGFEYTFDMDRRTFSAIRHYFFIEKKWPLESRKMAPALAVGFVWESAKKYTGSLGTNRQNDEFQFILRPNIEF
jgi:hypothetical protein